MSKARPFNCQCDYRYTCGVCLTAAGPTLNYPKPETLRNSYTFTFKGRPLNSRGEFYVITHAVRAWDNEQAIRKLSDTHEYNYITSCRMGGVQQ